VSSRFPRQILGGEHLAEGLRSLLDPAVARQQEAVLAVDKKACDSLGINLEGSFVHRNGLGVLPHGAEAGRKVDQRAGFRGIDCDDLLKRFDGGGSPVRDHAGIAEAEPRPRVVRVLMQIQAVVLDSLIPVAAPIGHHGPDP